MSQSKTHLSIRIDSRLMKKFTYVTANEWRTKNKQIEQLIKKCVAEFEKEHGEINISDTE